MKIRKIVVLLAVLSLTAVMMACGSKEPETSNETKAADEANAGKGGGQDYPLEITHAFGVTTIEEKPERIAAIGWENQDTPLALGVVPVGVSAANYGNVTDNLLHTWTEQAFGELGEEEPVVFDDLNGFNYEEISDTNPDVILAAYSGMTQEEYELLSEIAPVVPYAEKPYQTTWRDQTILNAEGMGMKEEGEAKVAETEALLAEKLSEYPELKGTKTAFFWISADDLSTFYAYLPSDPRAGYLKDLGLEVPESIMDMAGDTEEFSVTISRENADQLDDVEMMIVYGDEELLKTLQADELMAKIPAIADGSVILLDSNGDLAAATTPSILSIPANIDDYLSTLAEAHSKIK